jgi:hypothetical protein
LALLPGSLTPALQERAVRLGSWLPFARTAEMLAHFAHVDLGGATARRLTERAGAAYEAVQAAALTRLERELPAPGSGPAVQQVSVDGAMVPLRHGQWIEVKTVVIGTVERDPTGGEVRAADLSTFSRHAEADAFARQATVELHRRGTATAGTVVGVADGALWCPGFYDHHRPDAVRILDFYHAQGYLVAAAQATFGTGTAATSEWLGRQGHALKHQSAEVALAALAALPVAEAADRAAAAAARDEAVAYLSARLDQVRYAGFLAAGYPIGSGAVESANKSVVEARLKGAGMHWELAHVNPMLALRGVACSDRWAEAWPQLTAQLRRQAHLATGARRAARRALATPAVSALPSAPPDPVPPPAAPPPPEDRPARPKQVVEGRPTADHPWRSFKFGRRGARPERPAALPKL